MKDVILSSLSKFIILKMDFNDTQTDGQHTNITMPVATRKTYFQ